MRGGKGEGGRRAGRGDGGRGACTVLRAVFVWLHGISISSIAPCWRQTAERSVYAQGSPAGRDSQKGWPPPWPCTARQIERRTSPSTQATRRVCVLGHMARSAQEEAQEEACAP